MWCQEQNKTPVDKDKAVAGLSWVNGAISFVVPESLGLGGSLR